MVVFFTVVRMHRSVTRLNVLGLILVLTGTVRYTLVSRKERKKRGTISAKKARAPAMGQEQRHQLATGSSSKTGVYIAGVSTAVPLLPTTVGIPTNGSGGGGDDGDGQREKVRRFASVSGLWGGEKGAGSRRKR